MQWTVERLDPMVMRGPRGRLPQGDVVEADGLSIENGTLIFITAGDVIQAYGQGAWASVTPVADEA